MPKPHKPPKRSVSPFGLVHPPPSPFDGIKWAYEEALGAPNESPPKALKAAEHLIFIPALIEKISKAAANDSPYLANFCQFVVRYWQELTEKNLSQPTYEAMIDLFKEKTSVFLVDYHDKEACEKLELDQDHLDVVLFSKERDILIGQFFAPLTEKNPGLFSDFIKLWVTDESPDRLLHFLDFCKGSKNPTFEYYLLFTHPSLSRLLEKKQELKALHKKAAPVVEKLKSPTWDADVRKALQI